jgi:hypothetical protein
MLRDTKLNLLLVSDCIEMRPMKLQDSVGLTTFVIFLDNTYCDFQ